MYDLKRWIRLVETGNSSIDRLLEQYLLEKLNLDQFLERARGVMELVRRGATEGERNAAKLAFARMMAHAKEEVARMHDSDATREQADQFLLALQQIGANTEAPKASSRPSGRPGWSPPPPHSEPVPKFKIGQWVRCVRAQMPDYLRGNAQADHVGKIVKSWYLQDSVFYELHNINNNPPFRQEWLRPATQDEIDAAQAEAVRPKAKAGSSSAGGDEFNIVAIAAYVSLAENSDKVYGIVEYKGKTYTFWGGRHKALATKHFPNPIDAHKQYNSKIARGYREMPSRDLSENRLWVVNALKARFAKLGL
jgi:hypothetical protein